VEFTEAIDRMRHTWAADRVDFAQVKGLLKAKNADHHAENGRLSQQLKAGLFPLSSPMPSTFPSCSVEVEVPVLRRKGGEHRAQSRRLFQQLKAALPPNLPPSPLLQTPSLRLM